MDQSTGFVVQRMEPKIFRSQWFSVIDNSSKDIFQQQEFVAENDLCASDAETIDESYVAAEITIRSSTIEECPSRVEIKTPVYRQQCQFFYDPSAGIKAKMEPLESTEPHNGHCECVNSIHELEVSNSHREEPIKLSVMHWNREETNDTVKSEHHIIIRPENPGMVNTTEKSPEIVKNIEKDKTIEQVSESLHASESQEAFENLFARYGSQNGEFTDTDMDDLILAQKESTSPNPFLNRRNSRRGSSTRSPQTFDKLHCYACHKPVYAFESIHVMDRSYHKFCFRCRKCSRVLSIGNFSVGEGYPFCEQHYMELFKVRGRYDGPIQGEPIEEYNDLKIHRFAVQSGVKPDSEKERPRPTATQSLVKMFQSLSESNGVEDDRKVEDSKSEGFRNRSLSSRSAETLRRGSSEINVSKSFRLPRKSHVSTSENRFPRSYSSERLPAENSKTKELVAKFTALMCN